MNPLPMIYIQWCHTLHTFSLSRNTLRYLGCIFLICLLLVQKILMFVFILIKKESWFGKVLMWLQSHEPPFLWWIKINVLSLWSSSIIFFFLLKARGNVFFLFFFHSRKEGKLFCYFFPFKTNHWLFFSLFVLLARIGVVYHFIYLLMFEEHIVMLASHICQMLEE